MNRFSFATSNDATARLRVRAAVFTCRFAIGLWLAAVAGTAGCDSRGSTAQPVPLRRLVTVLEVYPELVDRSATLVGRIEPWREATLHFEVPGVVAEMFVEEGQVVAEGDPIARLRTDDYELAVAQADSDRAAVAAQLALLKVGTRQEDLDAAAAEYEAAVARAAFWDRELERRKQARANRAVTAAELDEAGRLQEAAQAALRVAKARLDRAIAGPLREEIDAAAARLEARNKALGLARVQLERATLRAPFAGQVVQRLAETGTFATIAPTGGVPIVHLVDRSQVDAVIALSEARVPNVSPGQVLEIRAAADPELRSFATVASVGTVANPATGTYRLRLRLNNPEGRFTGGMVVTAAVPLGDPRLETRVPLAAVRQASGRPYVLVVDAQTGIVAARRVTLGSAVGEQTAVTSGLTGGELVVVQGQHLIAAGDVVRFQRSTEETIAETRAPGP
jgi:multidrug efflux pump subunit AcrA (membrane-fusion protein)